MNIKDEIKKYLDSIDGSVYLNNTTCNVIDNIQCRLDDLDRLNEYLESVENDTTLGERAYNVVRKVLDLIYAFYDGLQSGSMTITRLEMRTTDEVKIFIDHETCRASIVFLKEGPQKTHGDYIPASDAIMTDKGRGKEHPVVFSATTGNILQEW